jgi:hypothetical protein
MSAALLVASWAVDSIVKRRARSAGQPRFGKVAQHLYRHYGLDAPGILARIRDVVADRRMTG